MSRPGPKPLPQAIKDLRGSPDRGEPSLSIPSSRPTAPGWMSAAGRAHWDYLAELLDGVGVLTVADGMALATFCETLAQYVECLGVIAEEGTFYELATKENGTIKKEHPAAIRCKQLVPLLDRGFQSFGLTPSARRNIPAVKKAEEVASEDFFSKRGRKKKA